MTNTNKNHLQYNCYKQRLLERLTSSQRDGKNRDWEFDHYRKKKSRVNNNERLKERKRGNSKLTPAAGRIHVDTLSEWIAHSVSSSALSLSILIKAAGVLSHIFKLHFHRYSQILCNNLSVTENNLFHHNALKLNTVTFKWQCTTFTHHHPTIQWFTNAHSEIPLQ